MALRNVRRVLMTADAMGGVWTYTRDLTSYLHSRGIEVLVAVTGRAPQETLSVPAVHAPLSLEWQDRAGYESYHATSSWLRKLADDFHPDVIHLNGYIQASADYWDVPVVVVAHSCVYSWWRAVHGCSPPAPWNTYRERVREGLRAATTVVAPTRAMLQNLATDYGFHADAGQVIHNASILQARPTEPSDLIAAAGRSWDEAKNLSLLEGIAPRLEWPLEIANGDRTHSETMKLFSNAAIFAHAALYEPFGLGVLEAARSQCALVLADIPSLRELWDGAAVFVNPRYPADWVEALNALSTDSFRRNALALRAYQRSLTFQPRTFGDAYLSLYESACTARKETVACA